VLRRVMSDGPNIEERAPDGRPTATEHKEGKRGADKRSSTAMPGLVGVGAAALALVCCGAAPLLVAVLSGVTLGAVLGVGVGVLAAIALAAFAVATVRRRRACAVASQNSRQPSRPLDQGSGSRDPRSS
jgi:Flp pilus assembly protein TadB